MGAVVHRLARLSLAVATVTVAVVVAAAGLVPHGGPALAQTARKEAVAWVKLCEMAKAAKVGDKRICLTHHERLDGNTGAVIVSAAIREIEGAPRKHLMVLVPKGMAIQPGIQVRIYDRGDWDRLVRKEKLSDDKGLRTFRAPFTLCHDNGCTAEVEATAEVLADLHRGAGFIVYAIDAKAQVLAYPIPLAGFVEALAGPPVDNAAYSAQRKKLLDEIARRRGAAGTAAPGPVGSPDQTPKAPPPPRGHGQQ